MILFSLITEGRFAMRDNVHVLRLMECLVRAARLHFTDEKVCDFSTHGMLCGLVRDVCDADAATRNRLSQVVTAMIGKAVVPDIPCRLQDSLPQFQLEQLTVPELVAVILTPAAWPHAIERKVA